MAHVAASFDEPVLARPPHRTRLPSALGFLHAMQANFISVWPDDAYARPVTHVRLGRRHLYTANAPELAKHVLLDNHANYHKSPIARRLFEPALGQGLLTSDGPLWKAHRHLIAPVFVHQRMAALVPAMVEETRAAIADWDAHAGAAFDLTHALSLITLHIITRTMFGKESLADTASIADDTERYQHVLRPSVLDFIDAPEWIPRPGMKQAKLIANRLTETIYRVIAKRRALGEARDDLLAIMLRAVDEQGIPLGEVRDEIATVFGAGHETTAASLAWTLYLLDLHPAVQEHVVDELRDVLDGRAPEAADVPRLRFTQMVVEESLRLYPPAHSVTRIALGPDRLGEVAIRKGAVVIISPWLMHRNPTLWHEPERFRPERFDPEHGTERSRYTYIPFGAGPRICVGASFAMTETVVVLATILQRWRVRLVPDHAVEPVALITMRPRNGLRATVEPRSSA
jgi:cytochrome P450